MKSPIIFFYLKSLRSPTYNKFAPTQEMNLAVPICCLIYIKYRTKIKKIIVHIKFPCKDV